MSLRHSSYIVILVDRGDQTNWPQNTRRITICWIELDPACFRCQLSSGENSSFSLFKKNLNKDLQAFLSYAENRAHEVKKGAA